MLKMYQSYFRLYNTSLDYWTINETIMKYLTNSIDSESKEISLEFPLYLELLN